MSPYRLSAEHFQRITRAIADPNRYEMLRRIFTLGEQTCGSVSTELCITPGTTSHHLRELQNAELIQSTKDGRYMRLAPRPEVWAAYVAQLQDLSPSIKS